jgi:hypothetical protein
MASELFGKLASLITADAKIDHLLKSSKADDVSRALTEVDSDGDSLMHLAVNHNNAHNSVKFLLDAAKSHSILADVHMLEDANGNTPLHSSLTKSLGKASNVLISNLQNDRELSEKIYLKINELTQKTKLHDAIDDKNLEAATNLLEATGKVMSPTHKVMLSTVLLTMRDSTPHAMTAIERGLSDDKDIKAIDTTSGVVSMMLKDGSLMVFEMLTTPNKKNHCISPLEQIVRLDNVELFKEIMGKAKKEKDEDYQGQDAIKDILSYRNPEGKTLAEMAFNFKADKINAYIIEGINRDDSIGKQLMQAIGNLNAAKADASAQKKLDEATTFLTKTNADLKIINDALKELTPQKEVKIKIYEAAKEQVRITEELVKTEGEIATKAAFDAEKASTKAEKAVHKHSLKQTPASDPTRSSTTEKQQLKDFWARMDAERQAAEKKPFVDKTLKDAKLKGEAATDASNKFELATKVAADSVHKEGDALNDVENIKKILAFKEGQAADAEKAIAEAQALQFKIHAGIAISKAPQAVEDISSLMKSWIGYDMAKSLEEYSVLKPLVTGAAGITGAVLTSNPVQGASSIYQNQLTQDFIGKHFLSADNLTYLNAAVTTGMVVGGVLLGGVSLPAAGAMLGLQAAGVGINYAFDKGSAAHVLSKGMVDLASTGMTLMTTPGALLKTLDVIHGVKVLTDTYFNYPKGTAPAVINPQCYTDEAYKALKPEEKAAFKKHQDEFFKAEIAKYSDSPDAPEAGFLHSAFMTIWDHDYAA